jgi:hypothetical protein
MPTMPDETVGVVESQKILVPSFVQSCPLVRVVTVPTRFHDMAADAAPLAKTTQQKAATHKATRRRARGGKKSGKAMKKPKERKARKTA